MGPTSLPSRLKTRTATVFLPGFAAGVFCLAVGCGVLAFSSSGGAAIAKPTTSTAARTTNPLKRFIVFLLHRRVRLDAPFAFVRQTPLCDGASRRTLLCGQSPGCLITSNIRCRPGRIKPDSGQIGILRTRRTSVKIGPHKRYGRRDRQAVVAVKAVVAERP